MASSDNAFTTLLLYSMAMFTLPFIAFFGTKHLVELWGGGDFAILASSVIAAVLVVNIIIITYVWRAFKEEFLESLHSRVD